MSKPLSFKASLGAWRTMADNLAAHLEEMPQLRDLQEALLTLVDRGEALLAEASAHEAKLREVNHEKTVVFREGREVRNQLAVGLQAALGVHSERLWPCPGLADTSKSPHNGREGTRCQRRDGSSVGSSS